MFCALFNTLEIISVFLRGSSPPLCRQPSFVMDTSTSLLASKSPSIFVVSHQTTGPSYVVCIHEATFVDLSAVPFIRIWLHRGGK